MRTSGTTSNPSWRQPRRAAVLVVLAPLLIATGLTAPAQAATTPAEDSSITPTTPTDPTATTDTTAPGRLSTGKRIDNAADDAAGLDPASDDPAALEAPKPGDAGTEELRGEPGTCDDNGCGRLEPIVECSFKDPGTGLYNTVWSYRGGHIPVRIPPGWFNFFFPGAVNRGQPSDFAPGYHRNVVITTHEGSLTWVLGLRKATAPGRDCGHNPVPITGAGLSSIVTLLAVAGALGVVLLALGRRRRSARAAQEGNSR